MHSFLKGHSTVAQVFAGSEHTTVLDNAAVFQNPFASLCYNFCCTHLQQQMLLLYKVRYKLCMQMIATAV